MEETEFDRMMILTPGADGKSVLLTLRYGTPTPYAVTGKGRNKGG